MPATYEPIATTTTTGVVSNISFTGIPATYTHLRTIVYAKANSSAGTGFRFNNDSGSNYSYCVLYVSGTTVGGDAGTSGADATAPVTANLDSTPWQTIICDVFNYSGSTFKPVLITTAGSNLGTGYAERISNLYRSTTAINRLDFFFTGAQNFTIGTTITLYGIKAA